MYSSVESSATLIFASSKRGRTIMSMSRVRLSSKVEVRQSSETLQLVPPPLMEISVARKSSFSSRSEGAMLMVPPVRKSAVVMPVSPHLFAASRNSPPRKLMLRSMSGSSLLGARNTTMPFESSCRKSAAIGGVNESGLNVSCSGLGGIICAIADEVES